MSTPTGLRNPHHPVGNRSCIIQSAHLIHTPHIYCQAYTHDSWRPPWGRRLSDFRRVCDYITSSCRPVEIRAWVTRSSSALSPSSSTIRHGFGTPLSTSRRSPVAGLRTFVPAPTVSFFSSSRLRCRPTPPSRAATSGPAIRGSSVGCNMPRRARTRPHKWRS